MRDTISYIQRKIREGVYESIPRRSGDRRLFDNLTSKQEDAFNCIDRARGYDLTGLPQSRMRYSDAPSGGDYELTPQQLNELFEYYEWREFVYRNMPAVHYAVIAYIDGASTKMIEESLRIRSGKAGRYISIGLNEYCIQRKWGDQIKKEQKRPKIRMTGNTEELNAFTAHEMSITGKPMWIREDKKNLQSESVSDRL